MKKIPLLSLFLTIACLSGLRGQSDSFNLTLCCRFWATDSAGPAWYFPPTGGNPSIGDYSPDSICGHLRFFPAASAGNYCPRAECPKQDFANGVTILDALMLKEHVSGLQVLASDAQRYAADLNGSGSSTGFDFILLRQILLGQTDTLPGKRSWRLIFENQTFPDPTNPFGNTCPGVNYTPPATGGEAAFFSVKLGDLDGDAQPKGPYRVPQGFSPVELLVPDLFLSAGNSYNIPVVLRPTWTSLGLQAAFRFEQDSMEILSIENGQMELVQNENYSLDTHAVFRLAAVFDQSQVLKQGYPLFTLHVKANQNCYLRNAMVNLVDTLPAFLLDFERHIHPASVRFYATSSSALLSSPDAAPVVYPNPFRQTATLHFFLDKPGEAQLELRSATGALAETSRRHCPAGAQAWDIRRPDTTGPLWWFYTLRCGDGVAYGKILQIP